MMNRYYDALDADRRRRLWETVTAQIHGLLGLEIGAPTGIQDRYSAFVDDLCERVEVRLEEESRGLDESAAMQLILCLASDRERPVPSFIRDVCEIQCLPRDERLGDIRREQSWKPFRVKEILLEYAIKSSQIDEIIGLLTKGYCAESCDRLPTGCCTIPGYDLGLVPETMLELQRLEARKNGWDAVVDGVEERCRFHSSRGCTIALFKSPACIGHLCDQLGAHLEDRYSTAVLGPFLEALARFRNCCIDRSRVFEAMDAMIRTGRALVL
jgi:hypothetical protein